MAAASLKSTSKVVSLLTEPSSYEARLTNEREWAMVESDAFFQEKGKVHETLRRVSQRLTELGIPHAVVGGLALFQHGFRRFTEDVDLLVTAPDLKKIHAALEGRGYLPPFQGSKQLRDTETKVKVEFLTTGQYPGDGKEKPIAFPDPATTALRGERFALLPLARFLELKLASGMVAPHRGKDLVDVQEQEPRVCDHVVLFLPVVPLRETVQDSLGELPSAG